MGKFANGPGYGGDDTDSLVGMWVGPRPEAVSGAEGFEAMGQIVPFDRRQEGYDHLGQMGFTDRELKFCMVQLLADKIERDQVYAGMEELLKMRLDVTGIYRLLAVMLHNPPKPEPLQVTYADLYQ